MSKFLIFGLLIYSFSSWGQITALEPKEVIESEKKIDNNEFEVKAGKTSSFRRITINEKAIKKILKRLGKLEKKVQELESRVRR